MKAIVLSFTKQGDNFNTQISNRIDADSHLSVKNLRGLIEKVFHTYDAIVFVGAIGIAVRAIAPYIEKKDKDPAVIVCSEDRRFIVPILSGHMGGANELTMILADMFSMTPVITTATDINGVWAVDIWAKKRDYYINNIDMIKNISSSLLDGKQVGLRCDFDIGGKLPNGLCFEDREYNINVSPYIGDDTCLNIVPKCITLGVGSRKNAEPNSLIKLFESSRIHKMAVISISTIDIKKDEKSIIELSKYLSVPVYYYSAEELESVKGKFSRSEFVEKITGVGNVSDRAAMYSADKLIMEKIIGDNVTLSAGIKNMTIDRKSVV